MHVSIQWLALIVSLVIENRCRLPVVVDPVTHSSTWLTLSSVGSSASRRCQRSGHILHTALHWTLHQSRLANPNLRRSATRSADQRLGDCIGGRRGLLPRPQCDRFGGQRGERPPLDSTLSSDHSEKYVGHSQPARNPLRQRVHIQLHAGNSGYIPVCPSFDSWALWSLTPSARVITLF